MDKFFEARSRYRDGEISGGAQGYLESLHRLTNPNLPQRNNKSYEAAVAFRKREMEKVNALAAYNEELVRHNKFYKGRLGEADSIIQKLECQISKLSKKEDGPSKPSESGPDGGGGVPLVQTKEEAPEVPSEGVRTDVADVGGQPEEHSDEGRQGDSVGDEPPEPAESSVQ